MDKREKQKTLDELLLEFLIDSGCIIDPKTTLEDNIKAIRNNDMFSPTLKDNKDYTHFTKDDLEKGPFEFTDENYAEAIQYISNTYGEQEAKNFINGIRNGENTTINMKVNTQEASQRKPEPVQPVQPTQNFERQSEQSPQSEQPLQPAQPVSTTKRNPIRPLRDKQDAVAKEQRQQAEQIKESICRRIRALTQNKKIQVYTGNKSSTNDGYQLKYQGINGELLPVEDDMKLYWLVKSQKHIYISHETKGQEVSQNTEGPEELYAHFYYDPFKNSPNSRNSNQIICNGFGRFKNSDALDEYLKSQFQKNSPAPQEQPVQSTQPAEPVQPIQPTQPTQNFERQPRQSPQSEQPLQPARKQNPIPTSSQKSGITLDKETQITLDNALSNLIQDKSAKQHRIYFGKNNNQSFDYYSGNEDQKRTFAPYGNSIYLQNDEGKNVEDLQSYLNNGKTIYCYSLQQNEYIGHFKNTEKGITAFQSNKKPTQSQKQQRLKKNTGLQSTESTQVSPTQPLQPTQEQNPVSTSSQKSEDTLDKATQAIQQTTSPESKQQIEPQDPQEQPTPTTFMSTQQELNTSPLINSQASQEITDQRDTLLKKLCLDHDLRHIVNIQKINSYEDIKDIKIINEEGKQYLFFSVGEQRECRINLVQNYKNVDDAIEHINDFSSFKLTSIDQKEGFIVTDTYKKDNFGFRYSGNTLTLTPEKQEELNQYLKDTYDINLENTNCNVVPMKNKKIRCFHINFCNNGQNYTLVVDNCKHFSTLNATLHQVNENENLQEVEPIKKTIYNLTIQDNQCIEIKKHDISSLGNTSYTVTQVDDDGERDTLYSVIKEKDKEVFYVTKHNEGEPHEHYVLKKEGEEYKRYETESYIYNLLSERFPDTFNKNTTTELQNLRCEQDTVTFTHNDKNYSIDIPKFDYISNNLTPFAFCSVLNRPEQFECKCAEIERDNEIDVMQSTTEPEPMVLGTSQTPIIRQTQPEQQKLLSDSVSTQNTFDIMGSTSHNPEETHQNSTSLEKSENFDPEELHEHDTDLEKSKNFDPREVEAKQVQQLIEQIESNQTTEDMPKIPTHNPWPRKVEDVLKKQNVTDFKVQEDKYICKVGPTVCVLCTKGDSNDYQPYDRQTKLDNLEQLYLVEQDGDRLTNVKLNLQKQNWTEKGYSQWSKNDLYWKIIEPGIIPNTIPEQDMKDNKNSSSKTTDIASSDKGAKSTISIHRNNKQSEPVQTNQGPLRPQRPPQRPQRPPRRPQQPRGPQVVQTEIIPTVPPVQNLNEPVDNVRFDPVEVPESNTDIIKQDALLMSLNITTPPPLNSQLV